ncbi:MAG: methionine--tRNA ligase [archaeon]|nr:methionine--tRNA ligase [Nanoarchaeota archaeon]
MGKIKDLIEKKDKILVTAALPYANGVMHVGHLIEHIQVDVFTRFLKLMGKDALLICASDMHGTPIEINATNAGLEPEVFAIKNWKEQKEDFSKFLVKYSNYYHTNSPENKELAYYFFNTLKEKGYIYLKDIQTMYCDTCRRYLPDRYVKGICPHCSAEDQYGDICESCSTVLKGVDLKKPKCTICGNEPHPKTSKHYFFKLTDFSLDLQAWVNDKEGEVAGIKGATGIYLQKEMANWVNSWLDKGLEDWCISRDEPYFGFEIPGSKEETGEQKYLYVWLDAPIGYISSTKNYLDKKSHGAENANPLNWEHYWNNENSQVFHFIGKDIVYFHYLFWPMMLKAMEIPMPVLTTHGFITINGKKMSKSRGTFFTAREFHDLYGAEGLRFYFASHLDRSVTDIDLNIDEFQAVNNNVLIGNLGNFCYRTLSFAAKNYPEGFTKVANSDNEKNLRKEFDKLLLEVEDDYLEMDFRNAVKKILKISDLGNTYFQQLEPWRKRDAENEQKEVEQKVAFMVNLARNLSILVKPILPEFSAKIEKAFGVEDVIGEKGGAGDGLHMSDLSFSWTGKISVVEKLAEKVEVKQVEEVDKSEHHAMNEPVDLIKRDPDKFPVGINVGKILSVDNHLNADKLYILKVSFGSEIGERQIVSGLRNHFEKGELVGRKVLFCTNLKAAKFRGELSQGMVLMAEDEKTPVEGTNEGKLYLLEVPEDTELGEQALFPEITDLSATRHEIDYSIFQKYPMQVFEGRVRWKGVPLRVAKKDLDLSHVPDESKVC